MPYNTRRISLSLTSMGIHVPGQSASRANTHRSNSSNAATPSTTSENPPAKRQKRSHTLNSSSSTPSTPSTPRRSRNASSASDRQQPSSAALADNTPPPSPTRSESKKIDKDGIKDDVVVAVIEQLESTGNRPHLIRELAAVLTPRLKTVESSSNPTAIVSSRLTTYLRRSWTALAPCPLTKEQVMQHPRRVYYYLSTMPRQPIPETVADSSQQNRIISPSVSSGPDEEETPDQESNEAGQQQRLREELSPSPEIDLTAPEIDLNNNTQALSGLTFQDFSSAATMASARQNRSTSEPLEYVEREFNRAASDMEARKKTEMAEHAQIQALQQATPQSHPSPAPSEPIHNAEAPEAFPTISRHASPLPAAVTDAPEELFEIPESTTEQNDEAAATLFGAQSQRYLNSQIVDTHLHSSPMMRPITSSAMPPRDLELPKLTTISGKDVNPITRATENGDVHMKEDDSTNAWWGDDLKSPESVGLKELDDLLGAY